MKALSKRFLLLLLTLCLLASLGLAVPTVSFAEDIVISKVLTTLSSTPVALMDPSQLTVATSTDGCYIISATWFDANGKAASGTFNPETYRLEIRVGSRDGFRIDSGAACYLNNSAISSTVDGDGKAVTLTREYTAAVWAPTIYKNPGSETVNEDGWASFVVSGNYVTDYQWFLQDPTGSTSISVNDLKTRFPQMETSGDGSSKMMLYHIPSELDGWKVICTFVGLGANNTVKSQPALLTVIPRGGRVVESPSPSPVPDAGFSPEALPSPEISEEPEAVSPDEPEPSPHIHDFSGPWQFDVNGHWHICPEDGERADEGAHEFVWEEITAADYQNPGSEEGVCEICGVHARRVIPVLERASACKPGPIILTLFGMAGADVVLLLLSPVLFRKRKKKKSRRR